MHGSQNPYQCFPRMYWRRLESRVSVLRCIFPQMAAVFLFYIVFNICLHHSKMFCTCLPIFSAVPLRILEVWWHISRKLSENISFIHPLFKNSVSTVICTAWLKGTGKLPQTLLSYWPARALKLQSSDHASLPVACGFLGTEISL